MLSDEVITPTPSEFELALLWLSSVGAQSAYCCDTGVVNVLRWSRNDHHAGAKRVVWAILDGERLSRRLAEGEYSRAPARVGNRCMGPE